MENNIKILQKGFKLNKNSRVLDIGCGPGRLPIGILQVVGEINYSGIDVDKKSVLWCKKYIESRHPSVKFYHIDIANERYNEQGVQLNEDFKFDFAEDSFDIIYLYSVFSHMHEKEMRIYLTDFSRMLKPGGKVFFTTFVEENVPDVTVNPADYVFKKCSGALHVVRYEKNYLFSVLKDQGFSIDNFSHRTEADNQSAIYLTKQ